MKSLRFLQISDLHLDSSLAGSKLGLPREKQARINREIADALSRAAEIARAQKVDVVLCPGDLWDDEGVSFQSATLVYDTFAALAPIPVIITPGNHDPYNAFSYHHPQYYQNKVGRAHADNIVVFGSRKWERRVLPTLPDVDFYGCCFSENKPRTERTLKDFHPERTDAINVMLLHGSRDDVVAPGSAMIAAPFSRAEILASGFDYAALGHYHRHSTIEDDAGNIRAAYGGIPVARGLDEAAPHFLLLGQIGKGGVRRGSLETITVDRRRILAVTVPVDASITNTAAARDRIGEILQAAGVRQEDIVYATLEGRTHPDVSRFDFDSAWCDNQCFHLAVDQSALEPEYDIDALLADETSDKKIEGRFAARMKELMAEAQGDPARAKILRAALCYGMDALNGREVRPRIVY